MFKVRLQKKILKEILKKYDNMYWTGIIWKECDKLQDFVKAVMNLQFPKNVRISSLVEKLSSFLAAFFFV